MPHLCKADKMAGGHLILQTIQSVNVAILKAPGQNKDEVTITVPATMVSVEFNQYLYKIITI